MQPLKIVVAVVAAIGLQLSGAANAQAGNRDVRDQAVRNAEAQYKSDKAVCDALSGNHKDVCLEEAKGKEKVAKREAEAAYLNTPKAREEARMARADAAFEVAKEKCDDLSGNVKDVCVKEAKAAYAKAKVDAKVDRVAADTRTNAQRNVTDARRSAEADKREADYELAIEKCDALSGPAKDSCVSSARARFGKK